MSLFRNIFKSNTTEEKVNTSNIRWIPLTTVSQIAEIQALSKKETVLIFKHSTRCIISKMVIKQFEKSFDNSTSNLKVYYLDLLNYRNVSDEVGYAFQVIHQSPQLLVIQNDVAVAHASHYDILELEY
ncbi:bacillithiol system redox-active protein YtxJ [Polaribacter uvawellassae]|uniref:bacillithiol system redox-active protein YtxJ n=1 Tax=Polaribacter uvawellassae TaxID=3133495 RepID=UPI003219E389